MALSALGNSNNNGVGNSFNSVSSGKSNMNAINSLYNTAKEIAGVIAKIF